MKPKSTINLSLIVVAAGMPLVANAASLTWDGDQDVNWSTDNAGDTNWTDTALLIDALPVAGDDLSFGGIVNTAANNDVAAATSFAGIAFTNDGSIGTQDAPFTLSGNSIILGGDIATTATAEGTLEDTIDLDMELDANRSLFANPGHSLNITGDISGAFSLVLGLNNSAGKAPITLSGNNTHNLTALNRNASVRVESNTALGGQVNMARNASIALANGIDLTAAGGITRTTTGTPQQSISLNEDGTATASINASTGITNNLGGQFMNLVIGEDDTLTINGVLSGLGITKKGGLGTLVLTNPANTYTGTLQANSGSLVISGSGILGDSTSTLTMGGGSLDLGTSTQTIATLNISGAAASGDTIHNGSISATTYNANHTGNVIVSANLLDGSAGLAKSGNGTLTLSGTNTYTGSTTATAGTLITTQATALPGYDSAGLVTFNGGTIGVQVGGLGWTSGEMDDLLTNATKSSGALGIDTTNGNFILSSDFSGTIGLSKLGANSLTLSGNNTYTGNTTISEGTLNINSATALGDAASSLFIGNGTTIDNTNGSTITLTNNNPVILPGDGFTFDGTNDLNLGAGAVTLNLPPNNTTRTITLNGTGSTLSLGDSTSPARGGNTNIQVDGTGNTLVFNSLGLNDAAANRTNTWSGSGNVTVIGGVLDGGDGGQRFTYSGTGTFTIGGASTYTGNTIVSGGVLALGAGGSLSDNTNVSLNAGTIDLGNTVDDAIASLTIIGVNGDAALPDGTYGSTASGATNGGLGVGALDAYLTGSGVFTITTATVFETWSGGALFDEDTNGDGVDNGLAWILGAADADANALALLPDGAVSTGDLVMTFTIVDPIAPALLSLEYSKDLAGSWTSVAVPTVTSTVGAVDFVIVDNTGTLSVTATIPASEASVDGSLFGRLSATEN